MERDKEDDIEKFISESNAIEGIYDEDSFQQAMYAWNYLINEEEMSIHVMCKTHKILMLHQLLKPDERGYLRKVPVYIGNKEAMRWKVIPTHLARLASNINDVVKNGKKESQIFLEKITTQHHVEYEKIHPFVDGNGRTGRMFMNWERLKVGLPIQIYTEKDRFEYYKLFK